MRTVGTTFVRTIVKLELGFWNHAALAKPQLTAGIYARISYVRREDGTQERLGVERQVPSCRELARPQRLGGDRAGLRRQRPERTTT
jgi:hypothetical protein